MRLLKLSESISVKNVDGKKKTKGKQQIRSLTRTLYKPSVMYTDPNAPAMLLPWCIGDRHAKMPWP